MPRGFAPLRRGGTAAQQQPPSREIGRRPPGDCLDPSPRPAAVTTNAHRPLKLPLDRDSIARYIIGCRVAAYELTYGQPSLKGEIDITKAVVGAATSDNGFCRPWAWLPPGFTYRRGCSWPALGADQSGGAKGAVWAAHAENRPGASAPSAANETAAYKCSRGGSAASNGGACTLDRGART